MKIVSQCLFRWIPVLEIEIVFPEFPLDWEVLKDIKEINYQMQSTCPAITVVSNRDHDNHQNCAWPLKSCSLLPGTATGQALAACSICMVQVSVIER